MIKPITDVWKEFKEWLNTPEEVKQKKREKLKSYIKKMLDEDEKKENNNEDR